MPIRTNTFLANSQLDIGEDGKEDHAQVSASLNQSPQCNANATIVLPAGTIKSDPEAAQKESYEQFVRSLRRLASDLAKEIRQK